jgi:hypothetical protein
VWLPLGKRNRGLRSFGIQHERGETTTIEPNGAQVKDGDCNLRRFAPKLAREDLGRTQEAPANVLHLAGIQRSTLRSRRSSEVPTEIVHRATLISSLLPPKRLNGFRSLSVRARKVMRTRERL